MPIESYTPNLDLNTVNIIAFVVSADRSLGMEHSTNFGGFGTSPGISTSGTQSSF
jgi:hypothetical protein